MLKVPDSQILYFLTRADSSTDTGQKGGNNFCTTFTYSISDGWTAAITQAHGAQKGNPPIRDYRYPHLDTFSIDISFTKKTGFSGIVSVSNMTNCITI